MRKFSWVKHFLYFKVVRISFKCFIGQESVIFLLFQLIVSVSLILDHMLLVIISFTLLTKQPFPSFSLLFSMYTSVVPLFYLFFSTFCLFHQKTLVRLKRVWSTSREPQRKLESLPNEDKKIYDKRNVAVFRPLLKTKNEVTTAQSARWRISFVWL